jgi:hypothetical protein
MINVFCCVTIDQGPSRPIQGDASARASRRPSASGLSLLVTAIILCNTGYLDCIIATLRGLEGALGSFWPRRPGSRLATPISQIYIWQRQIRFCKPVTSCHRSGSALTFPDVLAHQPCVPSQTKLSRDVAAALVDEHAHSGCRGRSLDRRIYQGLRISGTRGMSQYALVCQDGETARCRSRR